MSYKTMDMKCCWYGWFDVNSKTLTTSSFQTECIFCFSITALTWHQLILFNEFLGAQQFKNYENLKASVISLLSLTEFVYHTYKWCAVAFCVTRQCGSVVEICH